MLTVAKSSSTLFWASPNFHDHKTDFAKTSGNCSNFSIPSPRTNVLSSNSSSSFALVRALASVAKTQTTTRRIFDNNNGEISYFCEVGNLKRALELLCGSEKSELELRTYCSILELCPQRKSLRDGNVKEGERVHAYLYKLGFGCYNTVLNSLVAFYFKSGRVESAQKMFDELTDRDVISRNSTISGYSSNGMGEKGVGIFRWILSSGVKVDLATIVNILVACADIGTCLLGRAVHAYAIKSCFDGGILFCNTLLDMYLKCGELDAAVRVFEKMGERSVVSWTLMIAGFVQEGLSSEAIRLFYEMERDRVSPDILTVTCTLHACACSGSLDNGKDVLNYIRENGMESNLFVCNALMDMYSKCGSMEDAHLVFSRMTTKDIISWNTMIGGYSKNYLPNEALKLFFEMPQESKSNSITAACVLPACASLEP